MENWRIIAVTAVVSASCLAANGFSVEPQGFVFVGLAAVGCEGLAFCYRSCRPDVRLAASLSAVAQMVVLSAAAGALSYVAAARGGPLWDATFASWDQTLGFDWLAYAAAVEAHPALAQLGGLAYDSLKFQLLFVLLALGFSGRTRALGTFVVAYTLAALATVLLSGLMPALGTFPGQNISLNRFPHLAPRDVYESAAAVLDLRGGGLRRFALADIYGIISFPSFHAACGVLIAVALWPVRALRWPVLALDGLMVAATPLCGGHYFVDVLAGAATALAASAAVREMDGRAARAELATLARVTPALRA